MKPELVFQTGTTKASKPRDASTGKSFKTSRGQSQQNRQPVSYNANHDDTLTIAESGYDVFIKQKGINSSQPLILGVIPVHTSVNEESIIDIQRNLNFQTLQTVSKIINETIPSLTQQEKDAIQVIKQPEFDVVTRKITNAYRAKSNYLTSIKDTFGIQITDGTTWNVNVPDINISNGSSITLRSNVWSISSVDTTQDWASSLINVQNLSSRTNITNLFQALKNSRAILEYGLGYIPQEQVEDDRMIVNGLLPPVLYAISYNVLQSLYSFAPETISSDFDSIAIKIFSMLNNEMILSNGLTNENIRNLMQVMIGDLTDLSREQNVATITDAGVFTTLLPRSTGTPQVMLLDNNLSGQTSVNSYITADDYFIMQPLTTDKELLKTRSTSFNTNVAQTVSQITTFTDKLTRNNNDFMIKGFLNLVANFIEGSALSDSGRDPLRLALLIRAYDDSELLMRIVRIMMLRDRLRNVEDYLGSGTTLAEFREAYSSALTRNLEEAQEILGSEIGVFLTSTYNLLASAVDDLFNDYLGYRPSSRRGSGGTDEEVEVARRTLNNIQIGRDSQEFISITLDNIEVLDVTFNTLYDDLLSSSGMLWDHFFTSANSLETGNSIEFTRASGRPEDPLTYKAAGIVQFFQSYRDHRAFALLLQFLSFMKTCVSGRRFSLSTGLKSSYITGDGDEDNQRTQPAELKWGVSIDTRYFDTLRSSINFLGSSPFLLAKNIERRSIEIATSNPTSTATAYADIRLFTAVAVNAMLFPVQAAFDTFTYSGTFLKNASDLLTVATQTAYNYEPLYGESLASLYTANSVTTLNHISRRGFQASNNAPNYPSIFVRDTAYLAGMISNASRVIPREEDSVIILCALPYGFLEKLGAYDLEVERDINVTLTFRNIDLDSTTAFEVRKTFPAASFIDPTVQQYSINDVASKESLIAATRLFFLNANGSLTVDTFTDDVVKSNELDSTSIIEYLRVLYGLDLDTPAFQQTQDVDASSIFPGIDSAAQKISNQISSLRLNDLITSRYNTTSKNYLGIRQKKIFEDGLKGFAFDKIVAIAVSGQSLSGSNNSYICDIIATATLKTAEDIVLTTREELESSNTGTRTSETSGRILESGRERTKNR